MGVVVNNSQHAYSLLPPICSDTCILQFIKLMLNRKAVIEAGWLHFIRTHGCSGLGVYYSDRVCVWGVTAPSLPGGQHDLYGPWSSYKCQG